LATEAPQQVVDRKRTLEPVEFARWVQERDSRLAARWLSEVRARQAPLGEGVEGLLSRFFSLLASMLPVTLGPYRDQLEPIWQQAAELYGSVAAQRGLAVGEAVDEFQILRELLIRELYTDPPGGGRIPIPLRDLLRVNRIIDRGVTQASVGHADVLFFALFQGSGVPEHLDEEVTREVTAQLDAINHEFREVMGLLRG
jgi:hypothetical protein